VETDAYRVEVNSYVGERRRVVVWRRGPAGPWIIWGSLPIPDDVDEELLIQEVLSRLPEPVAQTATDRVYLMLAAGLGR
jgi:hypothetical protein